MNRINRLIKTIRNKLLGKDKKKAIENTVIVIVIGVIIIIVANTFFEKNHKEEKEVKKEQNEAREVSKSSILNEGSEIEKRIEKVLSQIQGVGKVTVLITYTSGNELVPATDIKKTENITNEKDSGGGNRNITQNNYETKIVYEEEQGGDKKPIIIKEKLPETKGVIVVADGASDPQVKENLSKAVRVLMDVPAHKIQVFERTK